MGFWDKIEAHCLICSLLWKKTNPDLYRTDTNTFLVKNNKRIKILHKYIIIYIKKNIKICHYIYIYI